VTTETTELRFPSRIEAVAEASTAVAGILTRLGIDENAAFGIDMAVREAVTNAVLHGNHQDITKFVELTVQSSPGSLEIRVHDEGPGFDPDAVPDPTKAENLLKTSGRGIFFMRSFMDKVQWFIRPSGGTTVRMLKKIEL